MINGVLEASQRAAQAILSVYQASAGAIMADTKADDSPVTAADRAAHAVIAAALGELTPDIPVISEEAEWPSYNVRRHWQRHWLVDPLDGTREFLGRNGEFTVNIALIDAGVPVLGVVQVPVTGITYVGERGVGARRIEADGTSRAIRTRSLQTPHMDIVGSRRHGGEILNRWIACLATRYEHVSLSNIGSSLKFCQLAEGLADLYPRPTPVSEWDVAAAHAVLAAAGGEIFDERGHVLRYNTRETLVIPRFLAMADPGARATLDGLGVYFWEADA